MIKIIIPVYNESKNLSSFLQLTNIFLKKYRHRFYIINDGSTDNTQKIIKKISRTYPIKLLTHKINKGVAEAFKTGLTEVSKNAHDKDIVIIMEGDGTSNPQHIPLMIKKIKNGTDIVIASRYKKGGKYKNFPFKRLIFSKAANLIFQLLFSSKVKDYTIFYRAYSINIIKKSLNGFAEDLITTKYFAANTEMLTKMMKLTSKIEEIPFIYDYSKKRGKSGLKIAKNLNQYIKFIFANLFNSK